MLSGQPRFPGSAEHPQAVHTSAEAITTHGATIDAPATTLGSVERTAA